MTRTASSSRSRPWWVATVSGMASYIDAAAIVSFGTALVIYQQVLGFTPAEVGIASAGLTVGIAVGAVIGGRLGDALGRRPVFTATMLAIVLGAALLVFAESFPLILVGAIVVGLATGADLPVSLSTISEAAHEHNRGRLLGLSNILWLAGSIVPGVLAGVVASFGRLGGQLLFVHIGVVALIVMLGRLTIPESDTWIAARAERRAGVATIRADRASAFELLKAPYLIPFLGIIVFYALTNLAANTQGQFGTYLLVNAAHVDVGTAAIVGLPLIPLSIIGYLWFMRIADKPRRFTYFTIGAVAWTLGLLIPVVFGFSLTTYLVSLGVSLFGMVFSFEGIMKIWSQEQFPTLLRSTAQGTVIAIARFLAAGLASVTPLIVAAGPTVLYAVLAVLVAVGMTTAWVVFRTRDQHDAFVEEELPDTSRIPVA